MNYVAGTIDLSAFFS